MEILNAKDNPDLLNDKRLVDRHIVRGFTSGKAHGKYLADLDDRADRYEDVPVDEELLAPTSRTEVRLRAAAEDPGGDDVD